MGLPKISSIGEAAISDYGDGNLTVSFPARPSVDVRRLLENAGLKPTNKKLSVYHGQADAREVRELLSQWMEKERERNERRYGWSDTLCWSCGSGAVCPWMREDTPVPGWDAEKSVYSVQRKGGGRCWSVVESSYTVRSCPLYREDRGRRRVQRIYAPMCANLARAVILSALRDYDALRKKRVVRGATPDVTMESLMRFFRSDWCGLLMSGTEYDQDALLEALSLYK